MRKTYQGFTEIYNNLKNPDYNNGPIENLRALHRELDRAVLETYDWNMEVPPYTTPGNKNDLKKFKIFENELIDKLFVLNKEISESENRNKPK